MGPLATPALVRSLRKRGDLVIGVDGGIKVLHRARIQADLGVGDWDSLVSRKLLRAISTLTLPRRKDRSDLYYALEVARLMGCRSVQCTGVTQGRMDHHLASLYDLAEAADKPGFNEVSAEDPDARYRFLAAGGVRRWQGRVRKGARISVLPLGGEARGVTYRGLEYPLRNATLPASSLGLSNRASAAQVEVGLRAGKLVIILS